jgi:hypothetical protein
MPDVTPTPEVLKMALSRWWRERRFEQAYRRSIAQDLRRIGLDYEARFKAAKEGNDFDGAMNAYLQECRLPDLRLETLRSRRWRRKAERCGVEMPRDWWEHDEAHDLWYLTPDGRRHLKKRIAEERMWVVKQWFRTLAPVVALLMGLLGTIIGLLGIWRAP